MNDLGGKIVRKSQRKGHLEINKIYKYSDVNNNKKARQIRDQKPQKRRKTIYAKSQVEVVFSQVQRIVQYWKRNC